MKKMKLVLLTVAIVTAVTGAFAAKKKFDCFNQTQYKVTTPGNYVEAGQFGVNYYCVGAIGTCTYIQNPVTGQYEACRVGIWSTI
ncbi:MAG: hypothetical protein J7578_22860 [Chitinophagaceae bacterium]|nr:hypothetical protein [Chitinophagaceae bacterium]